MTTNPITTLPLSAIEPSPTNPRTVFDPERQKQMVSTIKSQGVLQRLLLRPWPGREGVYECVDGHRRLMAAREAGLAELPVDIRDFTTAQVITIQLVTGENGEPLDELDEARGFKLATEPRGEEPACHTVETLAAEIGRTTSHIYFRLELLKLSNPIQDMVRERTLPVRMANLIARLPSAELRERVIPEIVKGPQRTEPMTYREAEKWIHERYMTTLRSAPFKIEDETLPGPFDGEGRAVEAGAAGVPLACARCPLMVGNNPERWPDMKQKNVCTNPTCYRGKCDAVWASTKAASAAAGKRVLTEAEAATVFEKHSPKVELAFSSPWVDVNSKPTYRHVKEEVDGKALPTWRDLIDEAKEKKKIDVPICVVQDREGHIWEVAQAALVVEAAKAIGEDIFKKTPADETLGAQARMDRDAVASAVRSSSSYQAGQQAEAEAAKRRIVESEIGLQAVHKALMDAPPGGKKLVKVWDVVFSELMSQLSADALMVIAKAFGLKLGGGEFQYVDAVEKWATGSALQKQAALAVVLIAADMKYKGAKSSGFVDLCKALGLDVAKFEAEAAKRLAAAEPKPKGKDKPAKPKADLAASAAKKSTMPFFQDTAFGGRKKGVEQGFKDIVQAQEWIAEESKRPGYEAYTWYVDKSDGGGFEVHYSLRAADPAASKTAGSDRAGTNFGLDEGKYLAAKTLLVAGKPAFKVAEQLGITIGQARGVASREVTGQDRTEMNAAELEAAVAAMLAAGKSEGEISKALELSLLEVRMFVGAIDAKKNPKGKLKAKPKLPVKGKSGEKGDRKK